MVGVGAIIIRDGNILLIRRNQEPLKGQWSLPGGAVELGETLEEAIIREVLEETSLMIRPLQIIKTLDRIERNHDNRVRFHYVLIDFLCSLISDEKHLLPATDVSDARWVPLKILRHSEEFILPECTLQVIDLAVTTIEQRSSTL
ncbi:MAG: NUDIX hydrolase [Acidobacteriales bacterium]|nr:NUDIX hydrolase [Terriglobales bacterium]